MAGRHSCYDYRLGQHQRPARRKGDDGADGADGIDGINGTNGQDGKSAYDVWIEEGNTGSEAEFLESLKGADGQDGADGTSIAEGTYNATNNTVVMPIQYEDGTSAGNVTITNIANAGDTIISGNINETNGTVTLQQKDGDTITVGNICDSRLDSVSYDANAGKLTFTVSDHYNQDDYRTLEVDDIASKTALENEIRDRVTMDETIINDYTTRTNILDNRINSLGHRMNKVGAGAAALAALHPLDYDAENKLSFSAGIGNYAGQTAGAVGAFYRPNEDVMFSIGGTAGNGENMVNMGVSFALGKGSSGLAKMSKVELVNKVQDMEAKYEAVDAENKELRHELNKLKELVMKLAEQK